jgi:hypothetical protein
MKSLVQEPLTNGQQERFNHLEKSIAQGQVAFREVGEALFEIKRDRLYRDSFKTFEDYCQTRWNFSRQRAAQIVDASEILADLPEEMSTRVDTEKAARALKNVPRRRRSAVLKQALVKSNDEGVKLGSRHIREAASPKPPRAETTMGNLQSHPCYGGGQSKQSEAPKESPPGNTVIIRTPAPLIVSAKCVVALLAACKAALSLLAECVDELGEQYDHDEIQNCEDPRKVLKQLELAVQEAAP